MIFQVDGVQVAFNGIRDATEQEAQNYIDYVQNNINDEAEILSITVTACDDGLVDVNYTLQAEKFERIRRITG